MSNPEFVAPNYTTQDAATYKANIDASIAANGAPFVNLGCSYDSGTGTFTIHDAQGDDLSASNPGFVRFVDPDNYGYIKYISVEANQSFVDDAGSSDIVGNRFGFTTGVAASNDVPFFIYGVCNDDMDAVQFMIGRTPNKTLSPTAAQIGAPDDAVADVDSALFSFDNIDETVYDLNPCTCVGSLRMTMSASDDWTVTTLGIGDGIGAYQINRIFTGNPGHHGAASGTFISSPGTTPAFNDNNCRYRITREGEIEVHYYLNGDGGTDGVGTGALTLYLPMAPSAGLFFSSNFYERMLVASMTVKNGNGESYVGFLGNHTGGSQGVTIYSGVDGRDVREGDFTNGDGRWIIITTKYTLEA
jgi:hypothetical protein